MNAPRLLLANRANGCGQEAGPVETCEYLREGSQLGAAIPREGSPVGTWVAKLEQMGSSGQIYG